MAVGILGLGTYVPERILSNADFEQFLDTSDEWIVSRTGIRRRHIAAEQEFTSQLAFSSVEDLIRRHGRQILEGVGMVIVATNTPDALFPSTASLVQDHFGLEAGGFDLLAACPGWIYGLSIAQGLVASGQIKRALVIGAEALSKITDYQDRSTAVLFGDGAGAAVVGEVAPGSGFLASVLGTDGSGQIHLHRSAIADHLPAGAKMGPHLYMNGREVFKFAVRVMNTATLQVLERAGLTPADISLFVPHQANLRIIEAARERLGLPLERVVVTLDEYGNNSTASIPLALQRALDQGRLHPGDRVLLVSFGAGLTWAASVLAWGGA